MEAIEPTEILDEVKTEATTALSRSNLTERIDSFKQSIVNEYAKLHAELKAIEEAPAEWIKAVHDEIVMDVNKAVEKLKSVI